MNFFDLDPNACPKDAYYHFNILVIVIYGDPEEMMGYEDIWFTDHVTDPRPYAVHFVSIDDETDEYLQEEYGETVQYAIEMYPHCVLEIDPELGVHWYDMYEEEGEDPWRL